MDSELLSCFVNYHYILHTKIGETVVFFFQNPNKETFKILKRNMSKRKLYQILEFIEY